MRPSGRRALAAALLVCAALVVAGCAQIPTGGAVGAGSGSGSGADRSDVGFVPAAPAQGASAQDIVNGFIAAATGQSHDYSIAREFLTPQFAKTWNPASRVVLHEGGLSFSGTGDDIVVKVPAVGEVDANGVLTHFSHPSTKPLSFRLESVNGQLRIAQADNGVVLAHSSFGVLYVPRAISFFDPAFRQTVPDVRWFPTGGGQTPEQAATTIVRTLLRGPSDPLADPVTATAFPVGTSLLGHVTISGGTASVDLHVAGSVDDRAVGRMRAQLLASLRSGQSINSVVVATDGAVRVGIPFSATKLPAPNPAPLVLRGSAFGYLQGDTVTKIGVLGTRIVQTRPVAVTASVSQQVAAVLTRTGLVDLVTAKAAPVTVDRRSGLIAPTLDPSGWVYSVPRDAPTAIIATDAHGAVSRLQAVLPGAVSIEAIEVSRDGTRILALVTTPSGPRVEVAGIVRAANGTPMALSAKTIAIDGPDGTAIDATWVDSGSIALLTESQGVDSVSVSQVGGDDPTPNGRLNGAIAIVGATGRSDLTALVSSQQGAPVLATPVQGTAWIPGTATADVLAVQR